MFELEFELEQVFCDFRSSILTSFFQNFWKVRNRTNSKIFVSLEFWETPIFDPKTPDFATQHGILTQNRAFGVKNRGFQKFQTYKNFGICSIQNFPKLKKLKKQKVWKIPSFAGPYSTSMFLNRWVTELFFVAC